MKYYGIQSALIVAAHADDEVLGCGGTMALLSSQGITVNVAFVADGVGARASDDSSTVGDALCMRIDAAQRAVALLGARVVEHGDLPDNRLDTVPLLEVTKRIERLLDRLKPQLVLTHHAGDLNVDHRRVHDAVVTACRPIPAQCVRGLLFFEVPSSTEWQAAGTAQPFVPNWFQDISATLSVKRAALNAYSIEMRPWPHSRSYEAVDHLARWRGATVGVEAAEAFMMGRWINR